MSNLSIEPEFVAAQNRTFLGFRVGEQNFALPIEQVRQVTPMVQITPLPQFRPQVEGMITVRGEMVLVSDMRCLLGLPAPSVDLHTPIILVIVQNRLVGLIVDQVFDVFQRPLEQVIPPELILPPGVELAPLFSGVVESQQGMNLLIAPDHLFQPGEVDVLMQAAYALQTDPRFNYAAGQKMRDPSRSPARSIGKPASQPASQPASDQPAAATRARPPQAVTSDLQEKLQGLFGRPGADGAGDSAPTPNPTTPSTPEET